MKEILKPTTDETPILIIIGIVALYLLILGFIAYLFFLNRINLLSECLSTLIFTTIYIPRFVIINKLRLQAKIKAEENGLYINDQFIDFQNILDFKIIEKKPVVVFFFNNKMIVFQEALIHLKTPNGDISFTTVGTEKIQLLKEFLNIALK